jgi:hypothetical protein
MSEVFRACLAESRELFEFLLETATAGRDLREVGDRARAADSMIARVAAVRNPVRRELFLQRTAATFGVSESAVRARLASLSGAAPAAAPVRAAAAAPAARGPEERVGDALLAVALLAPHLVPRICGQVPLDAFPGTGARAIASKVYELAATGRPVVPAEVVALLPDAALADRAGEILADGESRVGKEGGAEALLRECLHWIAGRDIQRRIQDAKTRGDLAAAVKLLAEKDRLEKEREAARAAP